MNFAQATVQRSVRFSVMTDHCFMSTPFRSSKAPATTSAGTSTPKQTKRSWGKLRQSSTHRTTSRLTTIRAKGVREPVKMLQMEITMPNVALRIHDGRRVQAASMQKKDVENPSGLRPTPSTRATVALKMRVLTYVGIAVPRKVT